MNINSAITEAEQKVQCKIQNTEFYNSVLSILTCVAFQNEISFS